MKSPTRCLPGRLVSAMAALLVFSTSSHGQALHWDTNGTAAGFGNFSGAWNGIAANWNTDATGAAGGTLAATTTSSNALVISGAGATGVIDLSTSQSAASLDFTNTANLAAFQLSNGASLTLTGAITDTGAGNADIRIINTSEASAAAKLTASSVTMGVVSVTAATGGGAQFLTTGYDMTLQTQYSIGSVGGNTTVRQTAGTVTVHNAADRGFVFAPSSDHFLNSSLYTTRYILDGGTMRANRIGSGGFDGNNNTTNRWATSGRLEFNNGTIASLPNGTLVLQNGAAFGSYTGSGTKDMQHDTSKPFSIELAQSGTHTIHADGASGRLIVTPSAQLVDKTGEAGTVNKTGAGTLVFAGGGPVAANSYTGDTTVMLGAVATDYSLIAGQAATGGADPLANGYSAASTLVLAGGNYSLVGRSSAGATSATGVTLTPGTTLVNVGSTTGWVVGQAVSNVNFPPGTYIRRIVSATTIELNAMSTSLSVQTNQTLNLGAATFANTQAIHGVVLQQTGTITVTPGAGSSTTQLSFGQVSGPGGIHKAGTGTLSLTGNSTYTGDTVVSAGTLAIHGDCSAATGTISVAPGATLSLGPAAILGGPVISNGRVLPGTYHTPLTLSATSRVPITVRSATDYDTLAGDGTDVLAFENNTTLELNFTGYTPTAGDTFTLFPQWASRTGNASAVMVTTTGLDPQYALDTSNLLVNGSVSLRRVAASPIARQPDGTLLKLATGERFFPVGFNYIRLGPGGVAHATFHVTDYDGPAASTMFQRVAQAGYTTVRVFISSDASSQNGAGWQTSADTPLNATYLDHFADFLKRAAAEGILVQPSMPSFPWNTKYASIVGPTLPMITGANSIYFHLGHMAAREAYLIDFWNGIRGRYPDCAEALLCVDLENELNYDLASQPISLASGTFLAANGQSYDLATQKQNLADDMAVYWINRMGATIRSVLPTTLINANVFTPYAVGRTGPDDFRLFNVGWMDRMPFRPRALAASNADIVDIHFYWRTLEESPADFASIEFNTFKSEALAAGKVLVVGEFGSLYHHVPANDPAFALAALPTMADFFTEQGFQGWLLWTYDSVEQANHHLATDANFAIFNHLALKIPSVTGPKLAENFGGSSFAAGWTQTTPASWTVTGGAATLATASGLQQIQQTQSPNFFTDFQVSHRFQFTGSGTGRGGIGFRKQEAATAVGTSGYTAFMTSTGQLTLETRDPSTSTLVTLGSVQTAIDPFAGFVDLTVQADGPRLKVWANGTLHLDVTDTRWSGGYASFFFDNVAGKIDLVSAINDHRQFTLTTLATNGTITANPPSGTYDENTVVRLTATPDSGYTFSGWSDSSLGSSSTVDLTMNALKQVTANFVSKGEAVRWAVNFDGLANATTTQGLPASWTSTRTGGGTFRVLSNRLTLNGAGGEGVFTSGVIDISGGNVNLSLSLVSQGSLESKSGTAQDYFRLYTRINGGAETLVRQVLGNQTTATWSAANLSGNTLQIVIRSKVTDSTEFYHLDNLSVVDVPLPSPWQTADVGAVAAPGLARVKAGTWTLRGSGQDIAGVADEFRYVHLATSADCQIVAQVVSMTNTHALAKSGVMIRESTAANAVYAMVCATPEQGIIFQWRSTTGGGTSSFKLTALTTPKWLKIVRAGNSFTAFHSDDTLLWNPVGTAVTFPMASTATTGLAVTSRNDGTLCTSTVTGVAAAP